MSTGAVQTFTYRALDRAGHPVAGQLEAGGEREALRALLAQDLTPISVAAAHAAEGAGAATAAFGWRRRAKSADCIQLLEELGTLLKAGVPLGEALPGLALAYGKTALGPVLQALTKDVRAGAALGPALREATQSNALPLPRYALALVDAGEASGALAEALADAARQMREEAELQQELRNALTYPVILVISGLVAIMIVFVAVVPRFATLLKGGRAEIPAISRAVIELGLAVQSHLGALGALAACGITALVFAWRSKRLRGAALEAAARIPIVRGWLVPAEIGRWAAVLSALLANRVALLDALRLSRDVLALSQVRRNLDEALREVRAGRALSDVFSAQGWLGPTQVNLIRVGERSGQLPNMLGSLARLQTQAARQRAKRMLTLIEPAAILLIGGAIGFLLVSVMLAITGLNTARL